MTLALVSIGCRDCPLGQDTGTISVRLSIQDPAGVEKSACQPVGSVCQLSTNVSYRLHYEVFDTGCSEIVPLDKWPPAWKDAQLVCEQMGTPSPCNASGGLADDGTFGGTFLSTQPGPATVKIVTAGGVEQLTIAVVFNQ